MSRIADIFDKSPERTPLPGAPDNDPQPAPEEDSQQQKPAALLVPWSLADASGVPPRGGQGRGAARDAHRRLTPVRQAVRSVAAAPQLGSGPNSTRPTLRVNASIRPLAQYWQVIKRRWRTAAGIFVTVVAGVTAGALLTPPVYRATALLEIRPESAGVVPVGTLFSTERISPDNLETQFGILRSAKLARRVAADIGGSVGDGHPTSQADQPTVEASLTASGVRKQLIVNPQKGSRLVEVSFDASDPSLAARVVNSVLDNYLQLRMEDAQRSAAWLEKQLRDAERRLEKSERELQAYVRQHGVQVLETGKGEFAAQVNARLESLHDALAKAQAERIEKQSADELARSQASSRDLDSPVTQSLSVKLADLRREHARLASVFHEGYPSVQALNSQIAELERALDKETEMVLGRGHREYQAALRRESLLKDALARETAAVDAYAGNSARSAGYESLKRDLINNQEQFVTLSQKAKDVSISAALKASNVGIVDRAEPPATPVGSPLALDLGLAAVVGVFLAIGGVFLREYLDTSMRSAHDVDAYLGVPTLASIPASERRTRLLPTGADPLDSAPDPDAPHASPLAEAFTALRTAVLLNEEGPAARVLLITSADAQEGKTTVAINLALSLARLSYRVLVIDVNMRVPAVAQALGLSAERNVIEYLIHQLDWKACVCSAGEPAIDVLAGGTANASPADLLALPRMRQLVTAAAVEYDFVILDSPPVLPHEADVQSLASLADSVLLIVRQGVTPRDSVSLAVSRLTRVSGVVLNAFESRHVPVDRNHAATAAL